MDAAVEKAFDFAQEVTKQLITLSTGIIAVTITFLVDVVDEGGGRVGALELAWVFYLVSVAFGIFALMSMSGNLERPGEGKAPSIYAPNIVFGSIGQILCFAAGLASTLVFGFTALS
jgi:hypothetical protein